MLLRSLAPGGAEKQALLLTRLLGEDHDVRLVVLDREPRSSRHLRFLGEHGLEPLFLPDGTVAKARALWSHLRRERVEVLFTFLPSDTVLGAVVGRLAGVPRVYGGLRNSRLTPRKERFLRLVHDRLVTATVSNSRSAVEHFTARGFAAGRFRVIRNGIDAGPPPQRERSGSVVRLLSVGRFVPEKDHRLLLEAVRVLLDDGVAPEALRLVLVGSGPLEGQIRGRVRELGLESVVELVIDPPSVEAHFRAADVYLSASWYEGVSNSIQEALRAGLPVVATDVGDNDALVEEGVNGFLVPKGDRELLVECLRRLVEDAGRREAFGTAGRALLERGFSLERLRDDYVALLAEGSNQRSEGR